MPDYPPDSIQNLVASSWWEEDKTPSLCRGALVLTCVPFFSQIPLELVAQRADATEHRTASLIARTFQMGRRGEPDPMLPVAGLPRLEGANAYLVSRAKKRPCLVLGGVEHATIDRALTHGMSNSSTLTYAVVAPYYGTRQERRAGYNPEFVEFVKHAKCSRFFWDSLPMGEESILRLDQAQPLGIHHQSFEPLGYRLSRGALEIMDEWLDWFLYGTEGVNIRSFRELMLETEGSAGGSPVKAP